MNVILLSMAVVSLFQYVVAQPHGHRHGHQKREFITDYVTVTQPEVVVWVDQSGETVGIETRTPGLAAATSAPPSLSLPQEAVPSTTSMSSVAHSGSAVETYEVSSSMLVSLLSPSASPSASRSPTAQAEVPTIVPVENTVPSSEASTSTSALAANLPSVSESTATPPADVSDSESSGDTDARLAGNNLGITYSPYMANGQCKSESQVNNDFKFMSSYSYVRIYGVDCNQVSMVTSAAAAHGMKVFAGVLNLDNLASNLESIKSQVGGNWNVIDTISIGNELVNSGTSPGTVIAALGTARGTLSAAGYTGHIVTVDTFNQLIAHPELCLNSDYCAANCHAFFTSDVEAAGAGAYVAQQAMLVSQAATGKRTVITESGWPHAGDSNGQAVPSPQNQRAAISSLMSSFSKDLFVFTAFDDLWKPQGEFNVEQSWGISG